MLSYKDIFLDVDGTLHEPGPEVRKAHVDFFVGQIMEVKGLGYEAAKQDLSVGVRKYGTNTGYLRELGVGGGDIYKVTRMLEDAVKPTLNIYLKKDEKLREMLFRLRDSGFHLFALRNGTLEGTKWILNRLLGNDADPGVSYSNRERGPIRQRETQTRSIPPFEQIFPTSEMNHMKPDDEVFINAMIPPYSLDLSRSIFVGDKPLQDLKTPKKWGMRTVLVRSDGASEQYRGIVDNTIRTIYDLPPIILGL